MLLMVMVTPLRFVNLTGMDLLEVFSNCGLNVRVRGERLIEIIPDPVIPKPTEVSSAKVMTN